MTDAEYIPTQDFCNLHQHTMESHLDAICDIDDLFDRAKELGQKALAVTDHGSMGGIYKAWKASKRTGVKLIPGNEIYFVTNLNAKSKKDEGWKRYHLVLLAMNEKGYQNLLRITYESFTHSIYIPVMNKTFPRADEKMLRKYSEGLIALSACGGNIIAQSLLKDDEQQAISYAEMLKDVYGDKFYMEIQPHEMQRNGFSQEMLNTRLKHVAEQLDIPLVATCDAHYIKPEDEEIHDMLLAISDKKSIYDIDRHTYTTDTICTRCNGSTFLDEEQKQKCDNQACVRGITDKKPCVEFYVKSENEILDFFTRKFDEQFARTLVQNSSKIADMCVWADYIEPSGKEHIPKFGMKHISSSPDYKEFLAWRDKQKLEGEADDSTYMKFICWKGFHSYCKGMESAKKQEYWKRMLFEIEVYVSRGFASYMLIVADYIRWARDNGILVGPGRGSVGGSLAAFFMGIHKIDPIKYGLLFERFVNLQKKSLPDVDTDFAPSGRERVFEYVQNKYGMENVAYISNLNRFTPKVVITDVVRSLEIGGDKSEAFRIAKEATADIPTKAHLKDGRIIEVNDMDRAVKYATGTKFKSLIAQHPKVLDYAKAIVGLPRNYSTHAAGVVISDIPLADFVPIRRDKRGAYSVQYEKTQVEEAGLVKMDFLGLTTLDIISETIEQSQKIGIKLMTPDELVENTDDPNAYKVINSGNTTGCFQIEGSTLQPLCKPMKVKSIEDIAFVNALGRPNCSDEERQEFLDRRDGNAKVVAPHPLLEEILSHTYGISIYEEDLLRLAQYIAGWDLSEADGLRKLTKLKEKGEKFVMELEGKFIQGCKAKHNLPESEAKYIWDHVVVPYSKYGFNKAHAIAYSIIGYMTAYYKYYARAPFFASVLNSKFRGAKAQNMNEKVSNIKQDAKRFMVKIDVCDINRSQQYYVAATKDRIVTGLGAVKGLGEKALDLFIINQPYNSFYEFVLKTIHGSKRPQVQALAKAGAFDGLGVTRMFVHEHFASLKKEMQKYLTKANEVYFEDLERKKPRVEVLEGFKYSCEEAMSLEWSLQDKLHYEREVLGEYVSGTAKDLYPLFFKGQEYDVSLEEIECMPSDRAIKFEGVITSVKEIKIKKAGKLCGRIMAILNVENLRGETVSTIVWPDLYEKCSHLVNKGQVPIRGTFKVNKKGGDTSIVMSPSVSFYKG